MLLLILISIVKGQVFNYIPTQGTPPDPRFYSCLAYRDIDKSLFVFGGYDDGTLYNDLFLYNITTDLWSRIYQLNALYPRKFYVASRYSGFLFFSDLKKDTIYLYGGNGPYGPLSDLWSLTLSTRMWIPVFDASSINPFYDSSYTTFLFNKTQYIGIFGGYGVTQDGSLSYTNDLYL
jgi:Galactose oxidase, central domain